MRVAKMMLVLLLTAAVTALMMNRSIVAYTQVRYHFTLFEPNVLTRLCAKPVEWLDSLRGSLVAYVDARLAGEGGEGSPYGSEGLEDEEEDGSVELAKADVPTRSLWRDLIAPLAQPQPMAARFDPYGFLPPAILAMAPLNRSAPARFYALAKERRDAPPTWYRAWREERLAAFASRMLELYAAIEIKKPESQSAGVKPREPDATSPARPERQPSGIKPREPQTAGLSTGSSGSLPQGQGTPEANSQQAYIQQPPAPVSYPEGPAAIGQDGAPTGTGQGADTAAVAPHPAGGADAALRPPASGAEVTAAPPAPQSDPEQAGRRNTPLPGGTQEAVEGVAGDLKPRPPLPRTQHGDDWRLKIRPGAEFLLIGDSLMQAMTWGLEHDLRQKGYKVVNIAKSSTGLTNRAFYNWSEVLEAQLKKSSPDYVVVMIGANDPWGIQDGKKVYPFKSAEWDEAYAGRVGEIVSMAQEKGAEVIWYKLPAMRSPGYNAKIEHLNEIYEKTVKAMGGYWIDTDTTFQTAKREYVTHAKNSKGNLTKVRTNDGIHFTGLGAKLLGNELIGRLDEEPQVTAAAGEGSGGGKEPLKPQAPR